MPPGKRDLATIDSGGDRGEFLRVETFIAVFADRSACVRCRSGRWSRFLGVVPVFRVAGKIGVRGGLLVA